ncbi:hypothetical protein BH23ACT12_BH23ACT12_12760 [soil metagenome]
MTSPAVVSGSGNLKQFTRLLDVALLTGEFAGAEDAYRRAHERGRQPQPGLSLLRLRQGKTDAARATLGRALEEARGLVDRGPLLEPYVEMCVAGGHLASARTAAEELSSLGAELQSSFLAALSHYATGTVLLAEGEPRAALADLRKAWRLWHDLEVPYEQARTRVQLSLVCRAVGDEDGAAMEMEAARSAFQALGAISDLARVAHLSQSESFPEASGLTPREVEILRLVATGRTNRAIASSLVVSEKTVATHVGHIFTKLGLQSRSAATAYAYEHGLTGAPQ